MPDLVVFRLAAPMAAFGDIAVGQRRGTHARPSHSAVTGLLAAALGMARDAPGHEELSSSFYLVSRVEEPGAPLADFHTAQAPPQRRGRAFATRAEEVADKRILGTIVSRRDYLTDSAFTVLLWPSAHRVQAADLLAEALNRPAFAPYIGRRSCPLGAPVAALALPAETIAAAFTAYDERTSKHRELARDLGLPWRPSEIAFDAALREVRGGLEVHREETRRDRLVSRARWQFALRSECIARAATPPG
jgi:CRISPR system Cascade subunit CasD